MARLVADKGLKFRLTGQLSNIASKIPNCEHKTFQNKLHVGHENKENFPICPTLKRRVYKQSTGQAQWLMPVIPALWEPEAVGS